VSRASVINPYQKFYELDGVTPLSGGSITFYENETTDLLAIYSDSALTVPQTNPYELDAGGAINGDVYFDTLATLVTFDSDDTEIQTFDNVACFDQSNPLAVWDPAQTYTGDFSSNNIVQSPVDDNYYISIQGNNLNHEPSVSPLWWEPFGDYLLIGQAIVPAGYVAIGNATTGLAGVDINAKGSLIVGNGTLPVAVPASTNGFVLALNSGQAAGVEWIAAATPQILRSARTSNTVLGVADKSSLIDITSGTFSQTFAAAATLVSGWFVYIRNSGTGIITLDPDSGETIDGAATYTLLPGEYVGVQSNGSNLFTFELTALPSVVRSARTSNTILGVADRGTLLDYTSGTFSQTLTAAASLASGWYVWAQNSGTGVVTFDPDGGELIGGVATAALNPGDIWLIQCTGTAFTVLRLAGNNSIIYTSGATAFIVPGGVYRIWAELFGGGGGNGGALGGAGAGGYCAGWLNVAPGDSITATVGAAGTSSGTNGGNSTFSTLTANGGTGCGAAGVFAGGTASGGDINITGGDGVGTAASAVGGACPNGAPSVASVPAGAQKAGLVPGGGAVGISGTPAAGGRGEIRVRWV